MNDSTKNTAYRLPENAVYTSHIEISRLLQLLVANRISIHADVGSKMFIAHIMHVDLRAEHFVTTFCSNKLLNSEVMQRDSLGFTASYNDAHLAFEAGNPTAIQFQDQPAIQFALPSALTICHRRECPRVKLPLDTSLRCIADEGGFAPFEARIIDISHDGFGGIIYSSDIRLGPGTLLKACRIIIPDGKHVIADLELRYINVVTMLDGSKMHRSGFRFIQRPDEIPALVSQFVRDLDKR